MYKFCISLGGAKSLTGVHKVTPLISELKYRLFKITHLVLVFQITVYLGKRDFIDYGSRIDAIGMVIKCNEFTQCSCRKAKNFVQGKYNMKCFTSSTILEIACIAYTGVCVQAS